MFNQPSLIGMQNTTPSLFLPKLLQARASGNIEEYTFDSIKPKKKLKEMHKVLLPEKKKILFFRFGYKFNLKDRCVVCGMHQVWDSGDYLRPPIPLDNVEKGRPMRGTYCPKHASHYKQMEMLQQQILAEEHGLDFKAFIPKPRIPQVLSKGPLVTLTKEDILSLTKNGWIIKPPAIEDTEAEEIKAKQILLELETSITKMKKLLSEE